MDGYLNGNLVFINAHDRNAKFNLFQLGGGFKVFDVGKFYYHSKSVTYVVEVGELPGIRR